MKSLTGLVIVFILLTLNTLQAQQPGEDVLGVSISIEVRNSSIAEILEEIAREAGIFFSYNPEAIEADRKISVSYSNTPVSKILNEIFEGNCQFQILRDQVIITRQEAQILPASEPPTEEKKTPHLTFWGKIADQKDNSPIPHATISILGKTIGTISNTDGDFKLVIPEELQNDSLVFSCLGYSQKIVPLHEMSDEKQIIHLTTNTIRLREIKITSIDPQLILDRILNGIQQNYSTDQVLMSSFYREILRQDHQYINVSEAVMEIIKSPYTTNSSDDRIKIIRGRKSPDVHPAHSVDFKIQGGPYYITMLDVVKTMDTFLDPEFRNLYKYAVEYITEFRDRPTYVLKFKPREKVNYPCYFGTLYVDKETYALIHANFSLSRSGLEFARKTLIRKKPASYNVRPLNVDYQVSYRENDGKWYLSSAQSSIRFRVRSRKDKINSVFHSTSELLITDLSKSENLRIRRNDQFNPKAIFTETIGDYDEEFWGNYNIIKPNEDLRKALRKFRQESELLLKTDFEIEDILTKNNY